MTITLAYTSYSVQWITRISYVMFINLFFGILTYFVKPYTEDMDRWIDFFARLLIFFFCQVLPYYHSQVPQGTNDTVVAKIYSPFASSSYLIETMGDLIYATLADIALTAYVYIFTYTYSIRLDFPEFSAPIPGNHLCLSRSYLELSFDYLEKRNIGFENIFGLTFSAAMGRHYMIRRYGLVPYPDVRPADLVPMNVKLFEMKWASFFNLTIHNLHSSLVSLCCIPWWGGK